MRELPGISVVICCYNSVQRLRPTLAHLSAQVNPSPVPWELIIVDNASTDDTAAMAIRLWPADAPAPLRVVSELRVGVAFARLKGIAEANYPIVLFVDDDNWLDPGYLFRTAQIMDQHPEVAVTHGFGAPVFEEPPPPWFASFQSNYAISDENWPCGDVTRSMPVPFTAGMGMRKAALVRLQEQGFQPLLTGRQGTINFTAAEDTELCIALRLGGWRWWRDRELRFQHYVPKGRTNWRYCLRLARGGGASYTILDLYDLALTPEPPSFSGKLRESWQWAAKWTIERILRRPGTLLRLWAGQGEGDRAVFSLQADIGRLTSLLQQRSKRREALSRLRSANWLVKRNPDVVPPPPD